MEGGKGGHLLRSDPGRDAHEGEWSQKGGLAVAGRYEASPHRNKDVGTLNTALLMASAKSGLISGRVGRTGARLGGGGVGYPMTAGEKGGGLSVKEVGTHSPCDGNRTSYRQNPPLMTQAPMS